MNSQKLFRVVSLLMAVVLVLAAGGYQPVGASPAAQKFGPVSLEEAESYFQKTGQTAQARVVVELVDSPATVVYAEAMSGGLAPSAADLSAAQVRKINTAQEAFLQAASAQGISASVIYRNQRVYNGVAMVLDRAQLKALAGLPGIKAIHPLVSKELVNASVAPFIKAADVWNLGLGYRGQGMKVGVIDSGIDYLHTNFGGPGTPGAYAANNTTVVGDVPNYPGPKVAGGWDFAGDDYNAAGSGPALTPHPDPDPSDCLKDPTTVGHGSHVSGTVAGYGVKADGSTYMGPYGVGMDFSSMRIGPGMAPAAALYALRVFGCQGSTDVTDQAIEWSVDPNGDGDFSDHLDVINMSLGSRYGSDNDTSTIATNNAVLAGVIVVASAGNNGDTYYISGAPGIAQRALSVAASLDNVTYQGVRVNGGTQNGIKQATPGGNTVPTDPGFSANLKMPPGATYPATSPNEGCSAPGAGYYAGTIAYIRRGTCGFYDKILFAQQAGALGVVVYNNQAGLVSMSNTGATPITIWNFMITQADGDLIAAAIIGGESINVTLAASITFVPAATEADTIASFTSRGGSRAFSFLKPDITAPGYNIVSTANQTGTSGKYMSGTSMAAPVMTGVMAILRQDHPAWSVEELKALVMNTATHDLYTGVGMTGTRYDQARTGAGRVDVVNAYKSQVIAFNAVDHGVVSVSFGAPQVPVSETATLYKTVTVANKGGDQQTYNIGYDNVSPMAGVTTSVVDMLGNPLTALTIPARTTVQVQVKMVAVGSALRHSRAATVSATQVTGTSATNNRWWQSETSGFVTFTPTGDVPLIRLPVFAAPRPVSSMRGVDVGLPKMSTTAWPLPLQGTGLNSGTTPTDVYSLVSALELKSIELENPLLTGVAKNIDLKYVGVMTDYRWQTTKANSLLYFGIATYGKWATPNEVEFDVYIDKNQDGVPEFVVYTYNRGAAGGIDPNDVFISITYNLGTGANGLTYVNGMRSGILDTALFNNNVIVLPAFNQIIGLTDVNSSFDFWVESYSRDSELYDISDVMTYDVAKLPVDTTEGAGYVPIYDDLPGEAVTISYVNKANALPDLKGILLLHHHNGLADSAQVVKIKDLYFFPFTAIGPALP